MYLNVLKLHLSIPYTTHILLTPLTTLPYTHTPDTHTHRQTDTDRYILTDRHRLIDTHTDRQKWTHR